MKKKTLRRITVEKKERINRAAAILYDFLPLNSRFKKAITFTSIFAESSIASYLKGPDNKQQALQTGLEKLYRYHEKLPKSIIRKVVPAAIEYRRYRRNPLTKKEKEAFLSILLVNDAPHHRD